MGARLETIFDLMKDDTEGDCPMFKGYVLGRLYHTWNSYKNAYNKAVLDGKLFDKNGRKTTKLL